MEGRNLFAAAHWPKPVELDSRQIGTRRALGCLQLREAVWVKCLCELSDKIMSLYTGKLSITKFRYHVWY